MAGDISSSSHTSSGATWNTMPPHGPPLPPRNAGLDEVPPPIPPRPAGFGYQPVRNSRILEAPNQSTSTSNGAQGKPNTTTGARIIATEQSVALGEDGSHQYPSTHAGISPNQAQSYSDISHLFPDGKIPPPPPRPSGSGVSAGPQLPSNAGKPSMSMPPAYSQLKATPNNGFQGTLSQKSEPFAVQAPSVPEISQRRAHATKDSTPEANTHGAYDNQDRKVGVTQEIDVAVMDESFQSMRLSNSSEATPRSREDRNDTEETAYSSQQSSGSAPAIPEKVPLPTQQSPGVRSPTNAASATHSRQRQGMFKECISTNVTFAATWYTHLQTPKFPICAFCYETHISGSRFAVEFQESFCDDGEVRACRFSSPRIKDSLWKLALSSGSLDRVVDYMRLRPSIPNCVGQAGVKGSAGIKWYRTKNNDIPAMVVCQACYEDHILSHPKFGEEHFEPNTLQHLPDQTWVCDIAVPYICREYMVRATTGDWRSFVQSVPVRMSIQPCPGEKTVYPDGRGKKWFTPVNGPKGLLICIACYCDFILLTGQDGNWRDAGDNLVNVFGVSVSCFFGAQFNVRALAARTLDTNDHALFWKGVDVVAREPRCKVRMQSSSWYTLKSNPPGFEICRACYVTIAESMGVGHHFVPKAGVPVDSSITCSFNPAIARFGSYMRYLLELVYKQDPAPLEEFIKIYAFMPTCRRDTGIENASWFGWNECTICPECYHEFIRGTALADAMAPQATQVKGAVMCEMYSTLMRQIYLAACATDPPDPKPLLEYSMQRRAVWAETMPRARQILSNIRLKMLQQDMAMNNSMFYKWSGNLMQDTLPLEQTYINAATGPGYYNHMQIKGAEYAQQATAIGNEIRGSPAYIADELERRWRAVE
ncbi:hypothetical protein F5Y10DRAFT_67424 [Nemania abortiva]|nr:hypothetical protein F5Y10DRAFT_67424 [Nemania abortiva]